MSLYLSQHLAPLATSPGECFEHLVEFVAELLFVVVPELVSGWAAAVAGGLEVLLFVVWMLFEWLVRWLVGEFIR